ncbi:MAG: DAK2 domain-containing protein [Nocardioidaceae bacterium]|nr:DAK2 domain-containing protein [Nocardioidaceae bacterium]MCL2612348.1 DAK2 domain-containing protein [Nocardioidaceae bacterium]
MDEEASTRESGGIDRETLVRFADIATDALAAAREEIDHLNVYPVPDGDTGTNMYLTLSAGRDAIRDLTEAPLPTVVAAFARGALLGARGNSGVILSEMIGAFVRRLATSDPTERNATVMVEAFATAVQASYAAVGEPVEGTMLTVLRAASEGAARAAQDPALRTRDVITAAAAAARDALARTPEQLDVLARAGVIDAGGRGVCVILDAAETALTGRRPIEVTKPLRKVSSPAGSGSATAGSAHLDAVAGDLSADGPSYEVMFLLDAADDAIAGLRAGLADIGDSVVVVGGDEIWNVHVHTDDVGAAIEAGIAVGRPHRIRVTHFAEQLAETVAVEPTPAPVRKVVAVAAGDGLAALFDEAGAVVVRGGPGHRASTGELLEAVTACGAHEVVLLPNDENTVRAAQAAAATAEADHRDVRVAVIPTHAQVQGLAAMAVHEPARTFDQDVTEMTATARHVRHGAVTVAVRQAITTAGPCEPGDILGVVAGDFAVVGQDLRPVAEDVLNRLLAAGGELVTIVSGEDPGDAELAQALAGWVEEQHPGLDAVVYDGGQERYPLLLSVE